MGFCKTFEPLCSVNALFNRLYFTIYRRPYQPPSLRLRAPSQDRKEPKPIRKTEEDTDAIDRAIRESVAVDTNKSSKEIVDQKTPTEPTSFSKVPMDKHSSKPVEKKDIVDDNPAKIAKKVEDSPAKIAKKVESSSNKESTTKEVKQSGDAKANAACKNQTEKVDIGAKTGKVAKTEKERHSPHTEILAGHAATPRETVAADDSNKSSKDVTTPMDNTVVSQNLPKKGCF